MSKTITKIIAGIGIVAGLGMAALPLSSYAADVAVNFTINPTIAAGPTLCGTTASAPAVNANSVATVNCTVTYSVNSGADVTIKDKDTTTSLTSGTNTIPAITTTPANLTAGTAGWGYKFAATTAGAGSGGLTAATNTYKGITASDVVVGSNTSPVVGAVGTFTFAAASSSSTPAGTYTDAVTVSVTPDA